MNKPKCWVTNVIKKNHSQSWVQILNYIFNPTFGKIPVHYFDIRNSLYI